MRIRREDNDVLKRSVVGSSEMYTTMQLRKRTGNSVKLQSTLKTKRTTHNALAMIMKNKSRMTN